jgi:tripartite-type tricarboxylate transporter receptor subunit TctC
LAGVVAALSTTIALGQTALAFPDRPVTLVVGYPAGGGTDIQARLIAPFVEKHLGVPVVVENRPGASGLIGAQYIADAEPDGYTIGALNFPSMYAPIYQGTANYTADAFTPLANQVGGGLALTVNASSPITSVEEFVETAKANPLVVGVTGVGHPSHISALLFEKLADVDLNYVPFNGGGPARIAMLGNHVTYGFMNVSEIFQDHRSGDLRILATTGAQRSRFLPDVPTFTELGYDLVFSSLSGYGAPAGLPADVKATLVDAFSKALNDPEYLKTAEEREISTEPLTADDYAAALERGNADLKALWETTPWAN